jgi:hypothetical protein
VNNEHDSDWEVAKMLQRFNDCSALTVTDTDDPLLNPKEVKRLKDHYDDYQKYEIARAYWKHRQNRKRSSHDEEEDGPQEE